MGMSENMGLRAPPSPLSHPSSSNSNSLSRGWRWGWGLSRSKKRVMFPT